MSPVQSGAILGALAVSSSLLAWSLAGHMAPGSLHRISPGWLPLTLMVSLALVIAVMFPFHDENRFWIHIGFCLKVGTTVTILAAIPLWFVLRRGAVLLPRLTGPAAGAFAGLAGATALQIHCPNIEAAHILLSHLGTVILAAAGGFLLGSTMEHLEINRRRS